MAFDIDFIKQAGEAIDKAADAIIKIGKAIGQATKAGVAALDWMSARTLKNQLTGFSAETAYLQQHQVRLFMPRLRAFLDNATPAQWDEVKNDIRITLERVESASDNLRKISKDLAATDFLPDLVGTLMARRHGLQKLLDTSAPQSPAELKALSDFLTSYDRLIVELASARDGLTEHIRAMVEKGTFPEQTAYRLPKEQTP